MNSQSPRKHATANPETSVFTNELNPVVVTVIFLCERLTISSDINLYSLALSFANRWLPAAFDWSFLQTATFLFLQLQLLEVADLSYGHVVKSLQPQPLEVAASSTLGKFLATSPPAPSFSDRQLYFSRLQTSYGQVFIAFPLAPSFPGRPLSLTTTSQDCNFAMFLASSLLDQYFSSCQLARMQPHEAAELVRSHRQLWSSHV